MFRSASNLHLGELLQPVWLLPNRTHSRHSRVAFALIAPTLRASSARTQGKHMRHHRAPTVPTLIVNSAPILGSYIRTSPLPALYQELL